MHESWTLYLQTQHASQPRPWPAGDIRDIPPTILEDLPGLTDGGLAYSPTDGAIDMTHVPVALPRQQPVCNTELGIYDDDEFLYIVIIADRPKTPIPELADVDNEDFACTIPLTPDRRNGLYFGMNQDGAGIGCVQNWDPDYPPPEGYPFSLLRDQPGQGPSASTGGILTDEYDCCVIAVETARTAIFAISRDLLGTLADGTTIPLSVGRHCYATGECVSWGSPILWSPRPDQHGTVFLSNGAAPPDSGLQRLDLDYDPVAEAGALTAHWQAPAHWDIDQAAPTYQDYLSKGTLSVNGIETTIDLAADMTVPCRLRDGRNRIEFLTGIVPPVTVNIEKYSGQRIVVPPPSAPDLPSLDAINAAFEQWHEQHEQSYLGNGTWGQAAAKRHCLCHNGVFHIEPYIYAQQHLEPHAIYQQRIGQAAERFLAAQHAGGWFPSHCAPANRDCEPKLGEGGAFTNGSVGEGLVLAGRLLDRDDLLQASQRAADYSWYRWEINQNYAAFALWHLAALHSAQPEPQWLAKGLYFAKHIVTRDIGLSGAQNGHNYFTDYGNITLKGIARFLDVLPADHAFRPCLREKAIRFTNQLLSRQQPGGLFAGRNRKYLGYHHPVTGLFFAAAAIPEITLDLQPALAAMTHAVMRNKDEDKQRQTGFSSGLVLSLAARYIRQTQ